MAHWNKRGKGDVWVRDDGRFTIRIALSTVSSNKDRYFVQVGEGDELTYLKGKAGSWRMWHSLRNVIKAVDKEFPMEKEVQGDR